MVSNCLDVFELLFSADVLNISHNISAVSWSLKDLIELSESKDLDKFQGFRQFIKTLDLYVRNYNKISRYKTLENPFSRMTVLSYDNQVFAGTSPFTGFFTTSNSYNFV